MLEENDGDSGNDTDGAVEHKKEIEIDCFLQVTLAAL